MRKNSGPVAGTVMVRVTRSQLGWISRAAVASSTVAFCQLSAAREGRDSMV
jgi:hypothetical protein